MNSENIRRDNAALSLLSKYRNQHAKHTDEIRGFEWWKQLSQDAQDALGEELFHASPLLKAYIVALKWGDSIPPLPWRKL